MAPSTDLAQLSRGMDEILTEVRAMRQDITTMLDVLMRAERNSAMLDRRLARINVECYNILECNRIEQHLDRS